MTVCYEFHKTKVRSANTKPDTLFVNLGCMKRLQTDIWIDV